MKKPTAGPETGNPTVPTFEESAEDLYEHAPCGYLSMSPDGTIVRVNGTLLTWTGYRREQLVGQRRFPELLTAGGRVYFETHLRPMLQMQGMVREIALEMTCVDGRRLPVLVNATTMSREAGATPITRMTIIDAGERLAYERELLRTRSRIEQLQQLTGAMAAAADVDEVAEAIVDELIGDHIVASVLATFDRSRQHLEVRRSRGTSADVADAWRSLALAEGMPTTDVIASGVPVFLGADDRTLALVPALDMPEAGMVAALPLRVQGRTLGLLLVVWSSATLSTEERAYLSSVAEQSAQAIDRAELAEATKTTADQMAFLADAARILEESQTVHERAQRLVDLLVPRLADYATIELARGGGDDTVEAVAVAHRDEAMREPLLELRRRSHLAAEMPGTIARAISTGEPQLLSEIDESTYAAYASDEEQLTLLAPRSYVGLPLRARGGVVGALMLVNSTSARRFDPGDLPFLVSLADHTGLSLENARLYESEHEVSYTLQRSMIGGTLPDEPGVALSVHYQPAGGHLQVGGDWYDAFMVSERTLGVVVGDVVGKGVEAAAAMGQLRSAVRALARAQVGVVALLDHLDRFVDDIVAAQVATVAYAELELDTGILRWACAGHPPPLLIAPGRDPEFLWEGRSLPLGVSLDPHDRASGTRSLGSGSRLLLYTDGVVERRDATIDVGLERLAEEMSRRSALPMRGLTEALSDAMLDTEATRIDDDLCLLCLSFEGA